jgi:hypothetical protein
MLKNNLFACILAVTPILVGGGGEGTTVNEMLSTYQVQKGTHRHILLRRPCFEKRVHRSANVTPADSKCSSSTGGFAAIFSVGKNCTIMYKRYFEVFY